MDYIEYPDAILKWVRLKTPDLHLAIIFGYSQEHLYR